MLEIAVLADDITGAADTGIQFKPLFPESLLISADRLDSDDLDPLPQMLAAQTDSRALAADAARARIVQTAAKLERLGPKRVFKKVDSCMRGNVGAEVDGVVEAMGFEVSLIAPAFPEVGRTTVHDVHLVHGTPVAESEMGHDPATPVTRSKLTELVGAVSRHPVGRVDLDVVERGPDAIQAEIEARMAEGVRHITFDVTTQQHLNAIAAVAVDRFPKALMVGSAGLGLALRTHLLKSLPAAAPEAPVKAWPGHHLVALGTASEKAMVQVKTLASVHGVDILDLVPESLVDAGPSVEDAISRLNRGDLVIRIARPSSQPTTAFAKKVARGFGAFIAAMVTRVHPASLFMSGGDTALGVLDQLGATAIRLEKEIVPGLVRGTVVGGTLAGLPVGTKPGAFGDERALVEWRQSWS